MACCEHAPAVALADRQRRVAAVAVRVVRSRATRPVAVAAAQWLGYYAEAGIEVEIRSAFTPDGLVQAIPEVLEGRADFGIGAADVLVAIDGGANLMIASPVFQQSGFGLISRADSRISSPADLVGLRIAVPASAVSQAELNAMLVAEGIDANGIHWVETQPGETDRLIANGEIDAFFSFRSSAGRWRLSQGGVATNFLNPATYGVDFYGDSIFTSSRLADENPGLVQRFVEASIAGWQYAATHDHEIADRIAAELERTVAVSNLQAFNRSMFRDVEALIALHFHAVNFGHSNPDRWSEMFDVLAAAGLVSGRFEYPKFVFDPAARDAQSLDRLFAVLAVALIAALILAVLAWSWTLRKQVAARTGELAESEERFALAVEGTDAGIWDWKVKTGLVYRSPRFFRMLGYAEGELAQDAATSFDLIHPDDLSVTRKALDQHLGERAPYDAEVRMRHRLGHYIWVEARGQAVWDDNGEPIRMAGSVTDITDRVDR